jgi:hypothetical protein
MNYKRLGSIAVLLAVLAFPASASMVSVLVVETGLNDECSSGQYSSLWEGGIMAIFFDAGFIVTNSPIARMEKKPAVELTGALKEDFSEAALGGADYFILGFINYKIQGETAVPEDIAVRLYETSSQKLLFERIFPVGKGKSLKEEYQFAQDVGKTIISYIEDR